MDIAKLSMGMSSAKTAQDVSISMLKRTMKQMEQTGADIVKMIQTTEIPKEGKLDIKV